MDLDSYTLEMKAAWLACAIDGEGAIQVTYSRKKTTTCHLGKIVIVNTKGEFIAFAKRLLDSLGIESKVYIRSDEERVRRGLRARHTLSVQKQEHVDALLGLVVPYLVLKGQQALLVREMIGRKKQIRGEKRPSGARFTPQEQSEFAGTYRSVIALNSHWLMPPAGG